MPTPKARRKARFLPATSAYWRHKAAWKAAQGRDMFLPYVDDPRMSGGQTTMRLYPGSEDPVAIQHARACRAAAQVASQRGLGDPRHMVVTISERTAIIVAGGEEIQMDLWTEQPDRPAGTQLDIEDYIRQNTDTPLR